MAIVAEPLKRARRLRGGQRREAAQLYLNLESELGLNPDLDPGYEREADQAMALLAERFGSADELRELATDRGLVPSLSRGAKAAESADDAPPSGAAAATRPPSTSPTRGTRGRAPARGRRSGSSRRGGGGSRALRRTGIPGAADSASGFALQVVGGTVGLVLLYVLIRGRGAGERQSGAAAIAGAGNVFVSALRAVIAPTDPLAPRPGQLLDGEGGGDFGPAPAVPTRTGRQPVPVHDLPHGAAGAQTRR